MYALVHAHLCMCVCDCVYVFVCVTERQTKAETNKDTGSDLAGPQYVKKKEDKN